MLFCAGSGFGLITDLLVKIYYFRDVEANLMIPGGGVWDVWAERLRASGIFKHVWTNDGVAKRERSARRIWDSGKQKEAVRMILKSRRSEIVFSLQVMAYSEDRFTIPCLVTGVLRNFHS